MKHKSEKMRAILKEESQRHGILLTDEKLSQLEAYCDRMLEYNEYVNLTRITEPGEVAIKHVLDSLMIYSDSLFKPGMKFADIGTGGGFPGVPLAIFCKELHVTLVDSLRKRTDFLREATAEIGLSNVTVIHSRAEDLAQRPEHREKYDIVTARAVASVSVLAELCIPFLRKGGSFLVMKGPAVEEELGQAITAISILGGSVHSIREYVLPLDADRRTLIRIDKNKTTPRQYPRKAGVPQKQPL